MNNAKILSLQIQKEKEGEKHSIYIWKLDKC